MGRWPVTRTDSFRKQAHLPTGMIDGMTRNNQERLFLSLGVAMAMGLMWLALRPVHATQFGEWYRHYPAHFGAFAALAIVWTLALPRVSVPAIIGAIAIFGFVHEACEIVGHAHRFEIADALMDSAGAALGAVLAVRARPRKSRV